MSAAEELKKFLEPHEAVEKIVFGDWGWGGYDEPKPPPVPEHMKGIPLSWEEAEPLMQTWNFRGGYGSPDCYAVNVWTNERVIWITQYDGSTSLSSAPRNPGPGKPSMPGG